MNLLEGIKLNIPDAASRIWLSNGVRKVDAINGVSCAKPSYIAHEPWRQPTEEELKTLCTPKDQGLPKHKIIHIIQAERNIVEKALECNISEFENQQKLHEFSRELPYNEFLTEVSKQTARLVSRKENDQVLGFKFTKPGLTNTTEDRENNCYIGMHLDSWDVRELDQRENSKTRISYNFGKEERYLLFVNLEIKQITRMLMEKGRPVTGISQMIHEFYELFPTYPVIKLMIKPFEAYIAPADNMLHDGSSEGKKEPDINFAIRNYFEINPQYA